MIESKLYQTLRDKFKIPPEFVELFLEQGTENTTNKGVTVFKEGLVCHRLLFLESGYMRGFRLQDEKDYTHHFFSENWFVTDYESFLTDKPGKLYIETLTPVKYYEFKKADLNALYEQHPILINVARIIAEKAFLVMVDRMVELQTNSLQNRFDRLLAQHPKLFQLAPQKHIASYLGVTEQSLSRIRSQRNLKS